MSNVTSSDLNNYIDYLAEIKEPLSIKEKCQEYLDFILNVYPGSSEILLDKLKEVISNESTKNE